MKAILLCDGGANQRALANRLSGIAPLAGIGLIEIPPARYRVPLRRRVFGRTIGWPLSRAWRAMLRHYERLFPDYPDVPITRHLGVNAPELARWIERERPDLVLVSGTDLLRRPLIEAIGAGGGRVMNLHTGISPYIKGGPNCTNWALALGEFGLIGNTVMWLDPGIDSGNIIATERTPLTGRETLSELHIKVMDHAHDLYGRCLARFRDGLALPSVAQQSLAPGRLFLTRDWTSANIARAIANFRLRYRPMTLGLPPGAILVAPDAGQGPRAD